MKVELNIKMDFPEYDEVKDWEDLMNPLKEDRADINKIHAKALSKMEITWGDIIYETPDEPAEPEEL